MAEIFSYSSGLNRAAVATAESTSFFSHEVPLTMRLARIGNNLRERPAHGFAATLRIVIVAMTGISNSVSPKAHCEAANIHFSTPPGYYVAYQDTLSSGSSSAAGNNSIPFLRITDDLHEDRIPGAIVIIDPHTGLLTTFTDFDDLHQFNIGFDRLIASSMPASGALDVVNVVWLGDDEVTEEEEATFATDQAAEALRVGDWEASGADSAATLQDGAVSLQAPGFAPRFANTLNRSRKNGIGLVYGIRAIERQDSLTILANGGVLGRTFIDTTAENHIIGPQVGVVWIKTVGRWSTRLHGLASLGFNYGDVSQETEIGAELIPGATNRLLYAQPTRASHRDALNEISPNAELRAEINFRITPSTTIAINWSGVAINNALETDGRIRYFLPDMGLVDPGNQRLLMHHFFCGIEMVR